MDVKKYIACFLAGLTLLVVLIVGWGIYVNMASSLRIEERVSNKYLVLRAEKAARRNLNATLKSVDVRITALWKSDIESEMTGTISKIFVQAGDKVEAGQPLCEIVNHDVLGKVAAAEASVAESQADYINAVQRANRYIELVQNDAISKADYDTAIASRDAAQARLDNKMAQRDILLTQKGKLTVKSPGKGVVLKLYAKFGEYIQQGKPLALLADVGNLEADTALEVKDVELLGIEKNSGRQYVLEVKPETLLQRAYPYFWTENRSGELANNQFLVTPIEVYPDQKNQKTMVQQVVWKFLDGGEALEPTIYQNAKLICRDAVNRLAVPLAAVNDYYNDHDNYVYTLDDKNRLEKRYVNTGVTDGTYVEIESGIAEDEIVIVSDLQGLEPGMRVKAEVVAPQPEEDHWEYSKKNMKRLLFYMMK